MNKAKFFLLAVYLLLTVAVFGQDRFEQDTIVKGVVFNDKTTVPVDAIVSGVGADGSTIEIKTYEPGSFALLSQHILPGVSYVFTVGSQGLEPNYKPSLNMTFKVYGNPALKDSFPIVVECPLRFQRGCEGPPEVSYAKNSSELTKDKKLQLDGLVETLNDNPTIVIEISGRADYSEHEPEHLSHKRAEAVVSYLLEAGIDSDRLIPVAKGISAPYVCGWVWGSHHFTLGQELNEDFIDSLTDKEEVDLARRLNSMVEIKVLRDDYIPKK